MRRQRTRWLRLVVGAAAVAASVAVGSVTVRQASAAAPIPTPGDRAIDFFNAGGDMLLTVTPSAMPAMVSAVAAFDGYLVGARHRDGALGQAGDLPV